MSFKNFFKNLFKKNKKIYEIVKKVENKVIIDENTRKIVNAFGGINNITGFNNCAARLRYDVKNTALINEDELKELGASEVIFIGKKHVQVKFGTIAEELNLKIKNAADELKKEASDKIVVSNENLLNLLDYPTKKIDVEDHSIIYSPCKGSRIPLNELNDKAFEQLGSGYAIKLEKETGKMNIYSPVSGKVIMTYPTKHAYGILSPNNLEVLVHIGVDTVKMNGLGFESKIVQNQQINHGDLLATIDLKKIKAAKATSDIIVVITDSAHAKKELKLLLPIEIKHENLPWFKVIEV